ncbi:regulator of (H+)-ATPase in vacuolar membrane [Blyttiomyces sp. JEL0837]|nr:regulator of (H+)-ATPase in vacuolar membrane [Blyttiomyces sp. JEL0837]
MPLQRQILQQLIGGRANPSVGLHSNTVHTALFDGTRYLNQIKFQRLLYQLVQERLGNVIEINNIVPNFLAQKIAVTIGAIVHIFAPDATSDSVPTIQSGFFIHHWMLETSFNSECDRVNTISWHPSGLQLVVAGSHLAMWLHSSDGEKDQTWECTWKMRTQDPELKTHFDADPKYYDFIYVPHPQQVLNFDWRGTKFKRQPHTNVILTMCRDNVARVWCQGTLSFPYLFDMRAVIDPSSATVKADELAGSQYSLSSAGSRLIRLSRTGEEREKDRESGDIPARVPKEDDISMIHWLAPEQVEGAVRFKDVQEEQFVKTKRKSNTGLTKSKKLRDAVKDYPDMVFMICPDGAIVVWGIQYLDESPRRAPKALTIIRSDSAVLPSDYELFHGSVLIYHDRTVLQQSAIYFPAEISICAISATGIFASYTMNLEDFLGSSWASAHLRLEHMWSGHRVPASEFVRHPNEPLIASLSVNGDINFYRVSAPQVAIRAKEGLDLVAFLPAINNNTPVLAWVPGYHYALVSRGNEISIEELGPYGIDRVAVLDSFDPNIVISSIAVIPKSGGDLHDGFVHFFVHVASLQNQCTLVWTLRFTETFFMNSTFECMIPANFSPLTRSIIPLEATGDRTASGTSLVAHTFASITENAITFWNLDDKASSESSPSLVWTSVGCWESEGLGAIKIVRSDKFGRLAIACEESPETYKVIILSADVVRHSKKLAYVININFQIKDIDLHLTADGQSLLAVASAKGVDVFCPQRMTDCSDSFQLIKVTELTVSWNDNIKKVLILHDASVVVALSSKLVLFGKALTDRADLDNLTPHTIHSLLSKYNGRLPEYHPDLLAHYTLWGKHDLVIYILSMLHRYIKIMSEANHEILEIPSVLWKFFSRQEAVKTEAKYDDLFSMSDSQDRESNEIGDFTPNHNEFLREYLTRKSLPHLSHIDQMRLLAFMDTIVQLEGQKRSLDDNGARFVLYAKIFLFGQKSFPASHLPNLSNRDIAWAFYSDSQDNLVDFVSQSFGGKPLWKDVRALGMGFWLRNLETLKKQVEAIARNQYMAKEDKDPIDCSLFYICLRKKNVLLGLWKLASNHAEQGAMVKFLPNDFTEDRWQKAAVKNAFALLGKQRYEYAVAFFLLGERLKDAVNVCLKQLDDIQLAIVICRLFEGDDSPVLKDILSQTLLPAAIAKGDRWLSSIIFSLLKDKEKALYATIAPLDSLMESSGEKQSELQSSDSIDPPLLLLCNHLRKSYKSMRMVQPQIPAHVERDFVYSSAVIYERMGCPALALDISQQYFDHAIAAALEEEAVLKAKDEKSKAADESASLEKAGVFDWSLPASSQEREKAEAFDWSQPVATSKEQKSDAFDWSQPASTALEQKADAFDWSQPLSTQKEEKADTFDWSQPVSKTETADAFDWSQPVSDKVNTSNDFDWSQPVSNTKAAADNAFDWGAPTSTTHPVNEEDEYEAFKRQMLASTGGDEADELNDEFGAEVVQDNSTPTMMNPTNTDDTKLVALSLQNNAVKFKLDMDERSVRLLQWILGMRMVHHFHRSAAAVSLHVDILGKDSTFSQYFSLFNEGCKSLCDVSGMNVCRMDWLLNARFREVDSLVGFVEIGPLVGSKNVEVFSSYLVESCNQLSRLAFTNLKSDSDFDVSFVRNTSRQILWSLIRWFEKHDANSKQLSLSVVSQAAASAFVCLAVCAIHQKDYKALWWMLGMSDRFFEILMGGGKKSALRPLIQDLLEERLPILPPDSDSDGESDDDFDDVNTDIETERAKFAEVLLQVVSLQHVGLDLAVYITHLKEGENVDEAHGFLGEVVLKRLSALLFNVQGELKPYIKVRTLKIGHILKYLPEKYMKAVWSLLRRTTNLKKMMELAVLRLEEKTEAAAPAQLTLSEAVIPVGDSKLDTPEVTVEGRASFNAEYEIIFRTKEIIGSFAINPLDHNCIAVSTHQSITELDVESSLTFLERKGALSERKESLDDLALTGGNGADDDRPAKDFIKDQAEKDKSERIHRNLSYDSLQRALKKSMNNLRRQDSSYNDIFDHGQRIVREVPSVTTLEPHVSLNYYLAGIGDGASNESIVNLYQFGQSKELVTYSTMTTARLTKCRFDSYGARFGATDTKGELRLWRFDSSHHSLRPSQVIQCNTAVTNDFTFLSSGTILATAGVSNNGNHISIWDTLLSPHKSRIKAFTTGESGAYSVVFSPRHHMLATGSKKGDIHIFDVRKGNVLQTFHAHDSTVKTIAVDETNGLIISGSTGGDIKTWDLNTLEELKLRSSMDEVSSAAISQKVTGLSSYGVMQIGLSEGRMYDTFNKVKNAVLQLSEYQGKVMDATNNEPWGASSTLMTDIANATNNYQHFNEIMEVIYKRIQERPSPTWRQTYKALQLLEYLIKNGSERVVDYARDHVYELKALKNFNYVDEKAKDQGINVRQRANEIIALLGDSEKIREERKKAKENKQKYTGVSSTGGSGGRFGGFGSDSGGYGSSEGGRGGYRDDYESRSRATDDGRDKYERSDYSAPKKITIKMSDSSSTTTSPTSVVGGSKAVEQPKNLLDVDAGDDWGDFTSAPAPSTGATSSQPAQQSQGFADFASFQSAPQPVLMQTTPMTFSMNTPVSPVAPVMMNAAAFPAFGMAQPVSPVGNQGMGMGGMGFANFSTPMGMPAAQPAKPANNYDLLADFGSASSGTPSSISQPLTPNARAPQVTGGQKKDDPFAKLVSLDANSLSGLGKKNEPAAPSLSTMGSPAVPNFGMPLNPAMQPMRPMQSQPMSQGQSLF